MDCLPSRDMRLWRINRALKTHCHSHHKPSGFVLAQGHFCLAVLNALAKSSSSATSEVYLGGGALAVLRSLQTCAPHFDLSDIGCVLDLGALSCLGLSGLPRQQAGQGLNIWHLCCLATAGAHSVKN